MRPPARRSSIRELAGRATAPQSVRADRRPRSSRSLSGRFGCPPGGKAQSQRTQGPLCWSIFRWWRYLTPARPVFEGASSSAGQNLIAPIAQSLGALRSTSRPMRYSAIALNSLLTRWNEGVRDSLFRLSNRPTVDGRSWIVEVHVYKLLILNEKYANIEHGKRF